MKIQDIVETGTVDKTFMKRRGRQLKYDQEKKAAPYGRDEFTNEPLPSPDERTGQYSYVIVDNEGTGYAQIDIEDITDKEQRQSMECRRR